MASDLSSIVRNSVKEKLARGEVVSSMTVRLVPNIEIVRLIKTAGFDSFYVDLEHSSLSLETTSQIAVMALATDIPCFVRVPENRAEYIQRVLDGGAMGIIAPGVRSAAEAKAVDGVDMVMIGTNDLMGDLGIPGQFDHPKVKEAYARTIDACRRHGKHVGVGGLASRDDLVAEFVRMGARYVSTGTDLGFLLDAATARAKRVADLATSSQAGQKT